MTGTRHGLLSTVADVGKPQDFVTAGLAPGQHTENGRVARRTAAVGPLPGPREPLRALDPAGLCPGTRLLDRADGMEGDAVHVQRHRDVRVGSFLLGEKEGGPEPPNAGDDVLVRGGGIRGSDGTGAAVRSRAFRLLGGGPLLTALANAVGSVRRAVYEAWALLEALRCDPQGILGGPETHPGVAVARVAWAMTRSYAVRSSGLNRATRQFRA